MNIAVIPARGGSKRIPQKNTKLFAGKPVIAWSIEAAIESGAFDRILVSTDDEEIAEIAAKYGAEVPFRRPDALSGDFVATVPVVSHAVSWLENQSVNLEYICCIYATAPFVRATDLQEGLEKIRTAQVDYAVSVTTYAFPVMRALQVSPDNQVSMVHPEHLETRSQDLEERWHDAGQFYWGTSHAWKNEKSIFTSKCVAVAVPRYRVQDIDTLEDWTRAEYMWSAMQVQAGRKEA